MRQLLLASAFALTFQSPAALATTYYINAATGRDTNTGKSPTMAFATIQRAVYQTHPGDVVLVENGTYGSFKITHSGTETAWITYQADAGQHPVVLKDGSAWSGIEENSDYVGVYGFTIKGNAQSITQAQADAANTTNYTTNGDCISVPSTNHHVKIEQNILEYCPGAGISLWGDYVWIEGNTIRYNAYWSHLAKSGVNIGGANVISPPGHIYVDGNLIYNNQALVCNTEVHPCRVTDGMGIIVDSNMNSPPSGYLGRVEIFNNIVYNNGGWGIVALSQHVDIYNNTTWKNGLSALKPAPYTAGGGEMIVSRSTDVTAVNNILYGQIGVQNVGGVFQSTNYLWDYNLLWDDGNSMTVLVPTGPHDLIADPRFTLQFQPPLAFQLQVGSPAAGSGTTTLMPPTNYLGQPRLPTGVISSTTRINRGAF